MKTLKLADDTIFEVTDDSTISNLAFPYEKYADIDTYMDKLTPENLGMVEFDGETYVSLTIVSVNIDTGMGQLVITTRTQTKEEDIVAQLHEMQDAIIMILEMIGGNE